MPIPSEDNLRLPLLKVLNDAGGSLDRLEAMRRVIPFYLEMKPEDLKTETDIGKNALNHRIY